VSPLTLRVLAVNVLALAILLGGFLYLSRYQEYLIQAEIDSLETEAHIFASAIGEAAVEPVDTHSGGAAGAGAAAGEADPIGEGYALAPELARQMVRRLVEVTETRTRLFDGDGRAVADSRVLVGSPDTIEIRELPPPETGGRLSRLLNRLYWRFVDALPSRETLPLYREQAGQNATGHPDVAHALAGEVSATVWRSEAESPGGPAGLMLTVGVPVQRFHQVLGAVLLSRAGSDIDEAIRDVRLDIMQAFAVALGVTVLLSFYLAGTVTRPIRRLAAAADNVRSSHGRHHVIPDLTARGDEIGNLSGVLRDMTAALWTRMDAIERFAADVAHEIKNPLCSLRSAVETASRITDPARRDRLMSIIADDVQRLDRLISDISNASRIDAELSRAELVPVDLTALLNALSEVYQEGQNDAAVQTELPAGRARAGHGGTGGGGLTVPGLESRLTQVFRNLLDNALSFSPPGGRVVLAARRAGLAVEVTVADDGPGIPPGKEEAIFERFYSERPSGEKFGTHSGLGLSISRQIVEAHGGSIAAANRPAGGAVFTVKLPAA
jgi:two-component system sensor histidine kinase ChvG